MILIIFVYLLLFEWVWNREYHISGRALGMACLMAVESFCYSSRYTLVDGVLEGGW